MYDPSKILTWLADNVQSMRRSRQKTLAAIVSGAMRMKGCGVLALGRAMDGPSKAKHRIKRVDRFLGNDGVENDALCASLFRTLCPASGHVVVLVDWTDRHAWQQLTLAVPCDGRAMPFYSVTIEKGDGTGKHAGTMIVAEHRALNALASFCPHGVTPTIIADRGFGHTRWLQDVTNRGWHFVQRVSHQQTVCVERHTGTLKELGMRRGWKARDFGWGTVGEKQWGSVRLVSVFGKKCKEAWYLLTNRDDLPHQIVQLYQRRMWIEAMFRDLKNRNWGLGLDHVKLRSPDRNDRLFLILALAYILLCAFGAAAEKMGLAQPLKANTVRERVMALARIGNYCIQLADNPVALLIRSLKMLPT